MKGEKEAQPRREGWDGRRGGARDSKSQLDLLTLDPVTLMLRPDVPQNAPAPPTHTWQTSRHLTKLTQQRNTTRNQRDREKVLCLIKYLFPSEKEVYLAFQIHWDPSSCLS